MKTEVAVEIIILSGGPESQEHQGGMVYLTGNDGKVSAKGGRAW